MKRILLAALFLLLAIPVWAGPTITGGGGSAAIDDTAGNGDTTYTWSADKIYDQLALKVNLSLYSAAGDILQGTGAGAAAKLTKGAEGTILRAGATSLAYSTSTFADTYAKGTFLYNASANTVASLAHPGAANYILTTNAADTAAWLLGTRLVTFNALADGAGALTNNGAGVFSYVAYQVAGSYLTQSQGLDSALPGTCTTPQTYFATDTKTYYFCTAANEWHAAFAKGADGAYYVDMSNNSTYTPEAGKYRFLFEGGAAKFDTNGTERTISSLDATENLTNKTLTAPLMTLARVDGHASQNLTAAQVSGTVIRNTGQALADSNQQLDAAAAGQNFIGFVGTTLATGNYFRFTAKSSPQEYMCLDGTCGKTYVSFDTPTMGDTLTCYTEQMSGTGLKNEADLGIGTSANTSVKNTAAVEFDIAGTGYSKAIAETAPGNDTIPQNKFGAVGFEIGADGTIDAIEATDNATGYDSAVLAIAGIPAVAASHTRLGTVTAMSTEAGGFVFGTTALNAANTTVAYTDAAVYTPAFGWVCITGKGTATTD